MRILLLGPAHPYRGGLATFNERLAEELVAAGHEVEVVTFTLQYPEVLFPGKSQTDDRPAPTAYPVRRMLNSVDPRSWWRTGRYLRQRRPDLIVARFWLPFMGPALGTALRVARRGRADGERRVVALIDNIVPHERRPGDRTLARYFARSVDAFLVMSRSVARELDAFRSRTQPVAYRPHPVYDNFGEPVAREEAVAALGIDPAYRYALFFGFIRGYKGLDLLLEAWELLSRDARFRESGPQLRLVVAGEYYEDESRYRELIDRLGIRDRLVLHTDFIPNDRVRYYFGAADLVVQPYRTATQSGISQMAYHFGVPMVVTRVGGLPEIVPDGEAGYVIDVDAQAVADAIARFFALSGEAQAGFRQNVRRLAGEFGWPAFTQALLDLAAGAGPQADQT